MRERKLPLRTVLTNFINHVNNLETQKQEGEDQYEKEFQELKLFSETLKTLAQFSTYDGEKEVNRRKNRYKDILPFDCSRVVLSSYPGIPGSDYINASYVKGASGSRAYIASQGPLPHTVPDFWRMVVECDVQVIIMASNETEGGKHKCECYWVDEEGGSQQFGDVTVSFVKSRQVCPDFLVKTLKIKYKSEAGNIEERTICQFHYVLWPDHGVPDSVRPLLDMVRLVRDCQASETLPVLVHCSAGCGRTGTICAIDYVWGLLRTGRMTDNLRLFELVKQMRCERVAMVQTREQYTLLHHAVRELFRDRLKVIDAHPYENVATDGNPVITQDKEPDYEELYIDNRNSENIRPQTAHYEEKLVPPLPMKMSRSLYFEPTSTVSKKGVLSSSAIEQKFSNLMKCMMESSDQTPVFNTLPHPQATMPPNLDSPQTPGSNADSTGNLYQIPVTNSIGASTVGASTSIPYHMPEDCSVEQARTAYSQEQPRSAHSGLVRRPSIQKLKELFEKGGDNEPTVRLSRSTSSVTPGARFSISSESDASSSRAKRKGSLDSEESLYVRGSSCEKTEIGKQFKICPPPPPIAQKDEQVSRYSTVSYSQVGPSKPPSSPVFSGNLITKPASLQHSNTVHDMSNSLLLSKLDDKPALPIKKSKSFRFTRGSNPNTSTMPSRSPETARKKTTDINTYFSLDRAKTENKLPTKIDQGGYIGDIPSPREGFKLSVYQDPIVETDIRSKSEHKRPSIPPKKSGDGSRSSNMTFATNTSYDQSQSSDISLERISLNYSSNPNITNTHSSEPNSLRSSYETVPMKSSEFTSIQNVSKNSPIVFRSRENLQNRDYVNAQTYAENELRRTHVPRPTKRTTRPKAHEYANYSPETKEVTSDAQQEASPHSSYEHLSTKYDKTKLGRHLVRSKSSENVLRHEYEAINFGEGNLDVDEVFETVNYEIVGETKLEEPKQELDSIAKQVYRDCQEYLLDGKSNSPIPSIMPKSKPTVRNRKLYRRSSSDSIGASIKPTDVEVHEVRSKVNVMPQGLRSRERRNSYRQAVNVPQQSQRAVVDDMPNEQGSRKSGIHKYEKIWFDRNMAAMNQELPSRPKNLILPPENYVAEKQISYCKETPTSDRQISYGKESPKDMNVNVKNNSKKDNMETSNSFMNYLKECRGDKPNQQSGFTSYLDDDQSSHLSGSSSNSHKSYSMNTGASNTNKEPIYVNTAQLGIRKPTLNENTPELNVHNMNKYKDGPTSLPLEKTRKSGRPDNHNIQMDPIQTSQTMSKLQKSSGPIQYNIPPPREFGNMKQRNFNHYHTIQHDGKNFSPINPYSSDSDRPSPTTPPFPVYESDRIQSRSDRVIEFHNVQMKANQPPSDFMLVMDNSKKATKKLDKANRPNFSSRQEHGNRIEHNRQDLATRHDLGNRQDLTNWQDLPNRQDLVNRQVTSNHQEHTTRNDPGSDTCDGKPNLNKPTPKAPPRIRRNSSSGFVRGGLVESFTSSESANWDDQHKKQHRQSASTPEKVSKKSLHPTDNQNRSKHNQNPTQPTKPSRHHTLKSPTKDPYPFPSDNSPIYQTYKKQNANPFASMWQRSLSDLDALPTSKSKSYKVDKAIQDYRQITVMHRRSDEIKKDRLQELKKDHLNDSVLAPANVSFDLTNAMEASEAIVSGLSSNNENSEDESPGHKFSGASIFRKFRGHKSAQSSPKSQNMSKSQFYSPSNGELTKDNEDISGKNSDIPIPTSPKPSSGVFGRLKSSSRGLASNFKSYLSQKGNVNEEFPQKSPSTSSPLQKSASSGAAMNVITHVQDNNEPKKSGSSKFYSSPENIENRPSRQQYL